MVVLATIVVLLPLSYTVAFFLVSRRRVRPQVSSELEASAPALFFVFVIPCLNEELVIANSIDRLLALPDPNIAVLVVDDGSDDDTAAIVQRYASERVWLLQRRLPHARQGKGEALNAALRHLRYSRQLPVAPDQIIVAVIDADGRLAPDAIREVTPYFSDPGVGAVQIGVRMHNADAGVLARLQDFEFVTFTEIFQRARQRLGSVGLGGNGQFARMTALTSLGDSPWTNCLTEDLELGIRLLLAGWTNSYCATTHVSQQAITRLRPLIRQRSRWFHGHMQCWRQIIPVLRSRLPLRASFDLVFHLTAPILVLLITPSMIAFLAGLGALAVAALHGAPVELAGNGGAVVAVWYVLSFGLAPFYGFAYRLRTRSIGLPRAVLLAHLFSVYCYIWLFAGWWAVLRVVTGRRAWAKTARSAEPAAQPPQ